MRPAIAATVQLNSPVQDHMKPVPKNHGQTHAEIIQVKRPVKKSIRSSCVTSFDGEIGCILPQPLSTSRTDVLHRARYCGILRCWNLLLDSH